MSAFGTKQTDSNVINRAPFKPNESVVDGPDTDAINELGQLRKVYEELFGKKSHTNAGAEMQKAKFYINEIYSQ